jgi:hypothetical protein
MSRIHQAHTYGEQPSHAQFESDKSSAQMFPPVCLKSHWDPTAMLKYILPERKIDVPQDFRPWTKVCKGYRNTAPHGIAPMPPSDLVLPGGGEFYPPGRYSVAIDTESQLKTLDKKLDKWCQTNQYRPPFHGDMYVSGLLVPQRDFSNNEMVSELAMPRALIRDHPYKCRMEADVENLQNAQLRWNNATKQSKFNRK